MIKCVLDIKVLLDAQLNKSLIEGGVDSSAYGHVSAAAHCAVTLDALQAHSTPNAHVAKFTCTHHTKGLAQILLFVYQ